MHILFTGPLGGGSLIQVLKGNDCGGIEEEVAGCGPQYNILPCTPFSWALEVIKSVPFHTLGHLQ
jgi:hypothetical protein